MIEYGIGKREHLPQILQLYRQLIPGEEPIGVEEAYRLWPHIERNNIKYFVALDKGRVVSCCYLAVIPNLTRNGKANGFIENVITDQDYRRRGIAKKLISLALKYAKENNCYKAFLLSGAARKESHVFYENCGFDAHSKKAFEMRL